MSVDEFAKKLHAEVLDRRQSLVPSSGPDGYSPFSETIFTELVLESLQEIGMVSEPELCSHIGRFRNSEVKLSAYAFSEEDDEGAGPEEVDLFVTHYRGLDVPEFLPTEDLRAEAAKALRFYKAVMETDFRFQLDEASDAFAFAERLHSLKGVLRKVRIFVLTDGIAREKKFKPNLVGSIEVHLEVFDVDRLFQRLEAGKPRDEIEVDFVKLTGRPIPCVYLPEVNDEYEACLAVIPGAVLAKLYDLYGSRLLELNVRSFLSATGKVNKGIRETLKTRPDRFLAFNNGIVVTADELVAERSEDGQIGLRYLKGVQIVNGGQTTASIHRSWKLKEADLSKVFVPAKISRIRDDRLEEMVSLISKYANSQNSVQPADFSANDPFHIELERLAERTWCPDQRGRWFYERARGSYQVALFRGGETPAKLSKLKETIPPQRRISKPEVAKYSNAWSAKPHLVSLGTQKNFDMFMQQLKKERPAGWLPDEAWFRDLVSISIIFREAQRVVRSLKFKASQANITAYLVSLLAERYGQTFELDRVWKSQAVSNELSELLRQWATIVDDELKRTAAGRQVSEWAKKEGCWLQLKTVNLPRPGPVPEIKSA
jgi:hypothetical protein